MSQFQPGVSGNPGGRPKGAIGGRAQALMALDVMLAKRKNRRALEKALEEEFQLDPVRFFRTVVMPLLPREARLSLEPEGVVQWRSLLAEDADGGRDLPAGGAEGQFRRDDGSLAGESQRRLLGDGS